LLKTDRRLEKAGLGLNCRPSVPADEDNGHA
jgi:hypothetical protein